MAGVTVLKDLAYNPSFVEERTETALAAVGIDLPQAKALSLDYLAEQISKQNHTLDLWRDMILPDDRSVRYLKTLHFPSVSNGNNVHCRSGGEVAIGIYLDALQRALTTDSCLDSESLFLRAGGHEVMLYHERDTAHDVHLSGDLSLLSDATKMYSAHLGEPIKGDVFNRTCNTRRAKAEGLTLTEQETSKAINMMVYYVSSSDGADSL